MSVHPLLALSGMIVAAVLAACAPGARLSFPAAPLESAPDRLAYDTDGDGRWDFALASGAGEGPLRTLQYDDDADGRADRLYDMDQYDEALVPHVVILVDSIPFEAVAARWEAGGFAFFDSPQKVIAPFPTMSGLIFSRIMHVPPLPGVNNRYYDQQAGRKRDMIRGRALGHVNPWQRRLDYHAGYWENGLAFLRPRPWFGAELERVRRSVERDVDLTTVAYIASSSGMLSVHGAEGLSESLAGLERLCLQLLLERQGAVEITLLSDHGHNLVAGRHFDLAAVLREAGYSVGGRVRNDDDVVLDLDGLVNYAGVHTRRPGAAADVLVGLEPVELIMYLEQDHVVVCSTSGLCRVERDGDRYSMVLVEGDPLNYGGVIEAMRSAGNLDERGFGEDQAWFEATVDHEYPDALRRAWDAFHGSVLNPPALMLAVRDGWYVGDESFEFYITMKSTHGGFNQVHSAGFVMTTTGRLRGPLRSHEVLPALDPRLVP